MSYQDKASSFSAMHVAISRDLFLQGGYLERSKQGVASWPWLHMHIKFGNVDGAVWANRRKDKFLVVRLSEETGRMETFSKIGEMELAKFLEKDGIFWKLAT